jgi:hypothetical protein
MVRIRLPPAESPCLAQTGPSPAENSGFPAGVRGGPRTLSARYRVIVGLRVELSASKSSSRSRCSRGLSPQAFSLPAAAHGSSEPCWFQFCAFGAYATMAPQAIAH